MTDCAVPVSQPAGVVTFLLTDMEGSTELLQRVGHEAFVGLIEQHDWIVREQIEKHGGYEMGTEGDSFTVAFEHPSDAVACAVGAQRELVQHPFAHPVRARMGLHLGEVQVAGSNYIGLPIHVAARISSAAWGGQILVSDVLAAQATLPEGVTADPLGTFQLKDVGGVSLVQLCHPELASEFPKPRASVGPTNVSLPTALTSLIGRDADIAAVARRLGEERLVTLLGPGGIGKTRLALAVAASAKDAFPGGIWWIDLTHVTDDADDAILTAIRAALTGSGVQVGADVTTAFGDLGAVLVLDNCEQVATAAARVSRALLEAVPHLRLLATSRTSLGIGPEATMNVSPLALPAVGTAVSLDEVAEHPALDLLADRVERRRSRPVTEDEVDDLVALARRVGGLPLALELAAARAATMSIDDVLARIDRSPRFLRSDDPTADPRQATIEGALAWSWDLLSPAERATLRRITVAEGPITLDVAEAVAGHGEVEDWEVADHIAALVRHSLLAVHTGDVTSYWFHPLVREFAGARIDGDGDDLDLLLDRRDAWIHSLVGRHEEALRGLRPDDANRIIERHDADLRAAVARFSTSNPAAALDCIEARFWLSDGRSKAMVEAIDRDAADPATRALLELESETDALLEAFSPERDHELLTCAARFEELGHTHKAIVCRLLHQVGAANPLRTDDVDEQVVRDSLDALAGHRLWLLGAASLLRAAATVVSADLRDRVIGELLTVADDSPIVATVVSPIVARTFGLAGDVDRARALCASRIAAADPTDPSRWSALQALVAIEALHGDLRLVRAHLEELSTIEDGHEPESMATPPPGHRTLVRALLAALDDEPVADLDGTPGTYGLHGALVDLLVQAQRWDDLLAQTRGADRSDSPLIWAHACSHLAVARGLPGLAASLHRRTIVFFSPDRRELEPLFRRMLDDLDAIVDGLSEDLADPFADVDEEDTEAIEDLVDRALVMLDGPAF